MRLVEMIFDEVNGFDGVKAISVVENPAIEEDFLVLNAVSDAKIELSEVDAERRLFIGAVLVPNKPILRLDKEDEPYHIFFSAETITKTAHTFLKNGFQSNTTLHHAMPVEGVTVVESWLVEDSEKDKSAIYGKSYPVGTWVAMQKIENDSIYEQAKAGKIKGFSIEGMFAHKTELSKADDIVKKLKEILKDV